MKYLSILLIALLLCPLPAHADMPTAKEVARMNNCPPKKIDVYQQSMGSEAKTIYRVECTMPKAVDEPAAGAAPQPDALLISCDESLCSLLRPIVEEKK